MYAPCLISVLEVIAISAVVLHELMRVFGYPRCKRQEAAPLVLFEGIHLVRALFLVRSIVKLLVAEDHRDGEELIIDRATCLLGDRRRPLGALWMVLTRKWDVSLLRWWGAFACNDAVTFV